MRVYAATLSIFALCSPLRGQGLITTVAGRSWIFPDHGKPAAGAALGSMVSGVAVDAAGRVYLADPQNHRVFRIDNDADRTIRIFAGNGLNGFSGEGSPAEAASLRAPVGLAIGSDGSVYIADNQDHRIRVVQPNGRIFTVAGTGKSGMTGDGGKATAASVNAPFALALDGDNNLYIADTGNHAIRRIVQATGIIETLVGTGVRGDFPNGPDLPAETVSLAAPQGVAVFGDSVYIADTGNRRVCVLSLASRQIRRLSGNGLGTGNPSGPAVDAALKSPVGLAVTAAGDLYVADRDAATVAKILPDASRTFSLVLFQNLFGPRAVAVDSSGNLFVTDTGNSRVLVVAPGGGVQTLAGQGEFRPNPEEGPASTAYLSNPADVTLDRAGNLFVADTDAHKIRRIAVEGGVTTYAGTGFSRCCSLGVLAIEASLSFPRGVRWRNGNGVFGDALYIADSNNNRVVGVDSGGILRRLVGTDGSGGCVDGAPPISKANNPIGLWAEPDQDAILFADTNNNRIRRWRTSVDTFIGPSQPNCGTRPAFPVEDPLTAPAAITRDAAGNLLIADTGQHRILQVDRSGAITVVAGTGAAGYSGDGGPARLARINSPAGIVASSNGGFCISDTGNHVVRCVDPLGFIRTVAGTGFPGLSGDGGPSERAALSSPRGLAFDRAGNLFIADSGNDRVRVIQTNLVPNVDFPGPIAVTANAFGQLVEVAVPITGLFGLPFQALTSSRTPDWLQVSAANGVVPAFVRLTIDPSRLREGVYNGSFTLSYSLRSDLRVSGVVQVTLTVKPGIGPKLQADPGVISISRTAGAPTEWIPIRVINAGDGIVSVTADVVDRANHPWLIVSAGVVRFPGVSGIGFTVDPANPGLFSAQLAMSNLPPGTYTGEVLIKFDKGELRVPVNVTINRKPVLDLTRTSIWFTAAEHANTPLTQQFGVLNRGGGLLAFEIKSDRPLDQEDWLKAGAGRDGSFFLADWTKGNIAQGTVPAGAQDATTVNLTVFPGSLKPGIYKRELRVLSPDGANAPQTVLVFVEILGATESSSLTASTSALVFRGQLGASVPGSQTVTLANTSNRAISFDSTRSTDSDQRIWFDVLPAKGTVQPGQSVPVVIQPLTADLVAPLRRGRVTFLAEEAALGVDLLYVLSPAPTINPAEFLIRTADGGDCHADSLLPVFASLSGGSSSSLAGDRTIEVVVLDSCGNPMRAGPVEQPNEVKVAMGADAVTLSHLSDGLWQGTWNPPSAADVTAIITARNPQAILSGTVSQRFTVRAIAGLPRILDPGVTRLGSDTGKRPLAPGSLISIYGANLAGQPASGNYKIEVGGTTVRVAGREIPIRSVSPTRIDAILPFDLATNTLLQVEVLRKVNSVDRRAEQFIPLADAQPWIVPDRMFLVSNDGTRTPLTSTATIPIGGRVMVECQGLGRPRSDTLIASDPVPSNVPATLALPVSVMIGDQPAANVSAELAPGSPGAYLVTFTIPSAAPRGGASLTIVAAQQNSQPVTLRIQ